VAICPSFCVRFVGARLLRYAPNMTLHVLVLGSAAGGGFPQWNCGCRNCEAVRAGRSGWQPRSQDSVAVSADGERWFLLNASPDVLRQVHQTPQLWPRALRHSPIQGVVLTNGDLDHVLGLFQLRESQPLALYATARVQAGLRENVALRTLERFEGQLSWRTLEPDQTIELHFPDDSPSGIFVKAMPVPGKPPLHLMSAYAPSVEDNIALRVYTEGGGSLVYASAVADARASLPTFEGCWALLMDGTFYSENELPDLGVALGPARSMAHQPISGNAGSLLALRDLNVPHRIYTHLNNTNPLLDFHSREHAEVVASGWQVAVDGMYLCID
jgi:pyrroloquinoline quinone biosynthesis protein B